MEVENRIIKEEASNEGASGAEDRDDGGGSGVAEIGTGSNNENETQEDEMHTHPKTIYSLNMNVCRLCLAEGHGQLQPIFYAQDTPDEILQQKILELTTVEITYASDFPTGVCIDCLAKLDEYSLFRRQCIDNNEILKLKYYELKAVAESYCKQEEDEVASLKEHHNSSNRVVSSTSRLPPVKKEEGFAEVESTTAEDEHRIRTRDERRDVQVEEMDTIVCGEEQQEPSPFVPFIEDGAESEIIIGERNDGEEDMDERQRMVAAGTKIQYVCEDGTMAEYVTSGAIVRRESVGEMMDEGHEIYYTVGTDTYAMQTNLANFVTPEFENQTEIECTTIEEHLPEEYVELEQQQQQPGPLSGVTTVSATVVTSRGQHDRPFVCKHCKTSFKYEHNYDRHMKNHAKVLYRCGKCSKTFVKLRKCQQHFVKAHSSQRYECDICFRTYSLPTRLENHVIEMHSVNGVYTCDRCQGEMFSSYLDFKAHRMRYHPRTNDSIGSGADTTVPTIIKQTAYGDVVHMQQVLTLNPQAIASSVSPAPSSEGCDMEEALEDGAANVKCSNASPAESRKRASNRAAPPTSSTSTQRARRTNGRTAGTGGTRNAKPIQSGTSPKPKPTVVSPQTQQEVILIDDDEHQSSNVLESPPGASVVMLHTNGGPNSTDGTGTHASAAVHRELLQQIEESEAKASGPKVYPCQSCEKTFVHLNNLKAHIYAEHDNDKPFKCKQCPISFKTKEILVMHMLLHAQNNGAT
uniref:Protein krueppel n=1 Tax=Anopheles atroparvus TaxID=41427 RepID=A0A182J0N6_ANOAO